MEADSSTTGLSAVPAPANKTPSVEFVLDLQKSLLAASRHPSGRAALHQVLPPKLLDQILKRVTSIVDTEPTLVQVQAAASQLKVTIVGDTHGQYHDLCNLFKTFGGPSAKRIYIFNGDYVDRGAWGVETLTLLLAWKWALPKNVYLLRGNHETSFCTKYYGFWAELQTKFGAAATQLYKDALRFFAHLPLAALVEGNTLILHGGLFRAPPKSSGRRGREPVEDDVLRTGTLDDLRAATKGGSDPDPDRSLKQMVASDVLWSDPSPNPGHRPNDLRGVGTVFGPDVTEAFLSTNKLKLIIRSHEGPDARQKRAPQEKMGSIDSGYTVDHDCRSGRLVTLFSAPDYPQFMAEGEQRYNNRAAVLHLTAPDYATPAVESFEADLPRPQAQPYYQVEDNSDTEHELEDMPDTSTDSHHNGAGSQHITHQAAEAPESQSGQDTLSSRHQQLPQQQQQQQQEAAS